MNALSALSHVAIFAFTFGILLSTRKLPARGWLLGFFGFYLALTLINVAMAVAFNTLDTGNEASLTLYQRAAFARNCLEALGWLLLLRFLIVFRKVRYDGTGYHDR